ncbi:MAG: MFS transporter, partial [Nitrososphaerales archaeon]
LIMLAYGFAGMGQAGYSTATAAYSIDMAQSKHVSRAIAWTQAARQTALSLGPAIGGILATLFGVDLVFVASAMIALTGVVISRVFLPEIRSDTSKVDVRWTGKTILKNPLILSSLIGIFTLQFANSVFSSFTPIYARELSYAAIGVIFAVQGMMNMVGRPVVGELSSKIKNRNLIVSIGMFMSFIGLFLLSLSTGFEPLIVVAVLVGLSTGIGVVLLLITIAEQVPKENRGFAMGFFNMSIYLGLGIGPAVEGLVIENFGYTTAFQTTGLVPLIGLLVLMMSRLASRPALTAKG